MTRQQSTFRFMAGVIVLLVGVEAILLALLARQTPARSHADVSPLAVTTARPSGAGFGEVLVATPFSVAALVLCFAFYFLPSLIAFLRKHPNAAPVLAVNVFFGCTGLGWLVAFIWSLTSGGAGVHHHYHEHS